MGLSHSTIDDTRCKLAYHLVERGKHTLVIGTLEIQQPAPRSVAKRALITAFGTRAGRLLRRELAADLARVERAAHRAVAA